MPQIMQPNYRQAEPLHETSEPVLRLRIREEGTLRCGEDQSRRIPRPSGLRIIRLLLPSPVLERLDCPQGQRNPPPAAFRLQRLRNLVGFTHPAYLVTNLKPHAIQIGIIP